MISEQEKKVLTIEIIEKLFIDAADNNQLVVERNKINGIKVLQSHDIPEGQLWFCNEKGEVIRKLIL